MSVILAESWSFNGPLLKDMDKDSHDMRLYYRVGGEEGAQPLPLSAATYSMVMAWTRVAKQSGCGCCCPFWGHFHSRPFPQSIYAAETRQSILGLARVERGSCPLRPDNEPGCFKR